MKYIINVRNMTLYLYIQDKKLKETKLTRTEMKFLLSLNNKTYTSIKELALIIYGSTDKCACGCVRLVKSRLYKKTKTPIRNKNNFGYKLIHEIEVM